MFHGAMANQTEMGVLAKSYIKPSELVRMKLPMGVKERLSQEDIKRNRLPFGLIYPPYY